MGFFKAFCSWDINIWYFSLKPVQRKRAFPRKWLAHPGKIFRKFCFFMSSYDIYHERNCSHQYCTIFRFSTSIQPTHHCCNWWLSISHGDKLFWQRVFYQIDAKVSTTFNERDVLNVLLTYTNFCEAYSCLNDIISIQDSAILTLQTNRRLRFYTNSIKKSSKICVISFEIQQWQVDDGCMSQMIRF